VGGIHGDATKEGHSHARAECDEAKRDEPERDEAKRNEPRRNDSEERSKPEKRSKRSAQRQPH
jgi:hypothetical protein